MGRGEKRGKAALPFAFSGKSARLKTSHNSHLQRSYSRRDFVALMVQFVDVIMSHFPKRTSDSYISAHCIMYGVHMVYLSLHRKIPRAGNQETLLYKWKISV